MLDDKLSVLLVDDNFLILKAYSALLQSIGYTVQAAGDGVEALQSLREHIPDLIVSDLDMPVMSGFELLSIVRRRFPSIQVVAMSGAFAESSIPVGLCADAFYPKGGACTNPLPQMVNAITERCAANPGRCVA